VVDLFAYSCIHDSKLDVCGTAGEGKILKVTTLPKSFIYQQIHFISISENIKIYIKTAPTCFGL